ncbi:phosphoglucosamine mutase [Halostella pelagica]|uniref:phosphoglucosamine mutase n=1 Tax=Halostella pelagica TaxID=2583824 RepID=UPI001080F4A8|nr:phosphoglucosamine mutase [Halostella pelagica]
MFGTSGIRGKVGEDVTADLALSVGRALAVEADRVIVGRDPRESGAFLADALTAGLRECGTDVVDLGRAATPTVGRAVAWQDADAGVAVTASHNPAPDNGIKLWSPSGQAFDESRRETMKERILADDHDLREWDALGTQRRWDGAFDRHVEALAASVTVDDPPSVAVDVGNGMGGVTVAALSRLGCDVETLNAQEDGSFPGRPSEPTAENCASLRALVERTDADLGIAHDGDADRMKAVTSDGEFVSGDVLLALFGREAAGEGDRVAAPLNTSLAVDDALAEVGASLTRTRVGDVFVAEAATAPDVAFGGEESGAWIWPEETLCPDGPLAACKLVELTSETGSLAALVDDIDTYPIRRDSIETGEKVAAMDRVREAVLGEYEEIQTVDGVRVDLGDGWFLVRASGTQPLVRITAEARDPDRADAVFEEASALVADSVAGDDRETAVSSEPDGSETTETH